jgi:hypothetical protein
MAVSSEDGEAQIIFLARNVLTLGVAQSCEGEIRARHFAADDAGNIKNISYQLSSCSIQDLECNHCRRT